MASRFTVREEEAIDGDVQGDLDAILAAVDAAGLSYEAVYLIGSFGRGEGGVFFDGERWRAINDYDLVVVAGDCGPLRRGLSALSRRLSRDLGVDFVDLGCLQRKQLPGLPLTMQNYDMKYGHLLIAGRDVAAAMPDYPPGVLPAYEIVRLLCNRSAGLLSSRLPPHESAADYRSHQYLKACIAVGDAAVFLARGYDHLYRVRLEHFCDLSQRSRLPFRLTPEAQATIRRAYRRKLYGDDRRPFEVAEELMQSMVEQAFCALAEHSTGNEVRTAAAAEGELIRWYRKQRSLGDGLKNLASSLLRANLRETRAMQEVVLLSLPFFYIAAGASDEQWRREYSRRFWWIPGALKKGRDAGAVFRLWQEWAH